MLRITENMSYATTTGSLARLKYQSSVYQQQVSSGLRINQASDDPSGASSLVRTDNEIKTIEQCQENIAHALTELNASDSALDSITELLSQAQETAKAMANGTYTAQDRSQAAVEIQGIREQILALANTQQDGVYIFNGFQTDTAPFDNGGNWVGDNNIRRILASPQQVAEVSVNGTEAFSVAGGVSIFSHLDALSASLTANDIDGIQQAAQSLEVDQKQVITSRSKVGALIVRMQTLDDLLSTRSLQLSENRSTTADADAIQTLTDLTQAQQALNSTLQVASRMLSQLTLVDKL